MVKKQKATIWQQDNFSYICYVISQAYLKALLSTGFKLPKRNRSILLSLDSLKSRMDFLESAQVLRTLAYKLYATADTSEFLQNKGIEVETLHEESTSPKGVTNTAMEYLARGKIDLFINIPKVSITIRIDVSLVLER